MKIHWRARAHIGVILAPMVVGLGLMIQSSPAQQNAAPTVSPMFGMSPQQPAGDDITSTITRMVENGQTDALSTLVIPPSGDSANLRNWTTEYLAEVQLQEKQRNKLYTDAVSKARDELKAEHFARAMDSAVLAYRIAKDPTGYLKLDWVTDMTAKVADRAAGYEKQGEWLESLQLYAALNTLYEIDTRYKADAMRLARRARLLAVYTPKVLIDLRNQLADKEKDPTASQPATAPAASDSDLAGYTPWQKTAEKVTLDMMHRVLQNTEENWVEKTSYKELVSGGAEALRLFLTTPELAKEFPALGDSASRQKFDAALNKAISDAAAPNVDEDDVDKIVANLIDASDASVKLPKEVVVMEFTDGAIEKLDPFTAVIWPHEVPEFEKTMTGNFGGVGIQISLEKENVKPEQAALNKMGGANDPMSKDMTVNNQYRLVVITPLPDTPAFKAGIQAGDVITGIDGKSTVGITVDQAVSTIMGVPGTPVTLTVKRGDKFEKDFQVKRDIIKVVSVKGFQRNAVDQTKWDFMLDPQSKIGYVSITGFQEDTPQELEDAIASLNKQGMRGLVLDLRFNPGGYLQAAVAMCDDFLESGDIVSTRGRSPLSPPQVWKAHIQTIIPNNMPMIVLVNEYSASASESFSGALKDLHRALIVGHRSFGKGSVQQLLRFGSAGNRLPESELKLTMAYYYLPNGESLHRRDGHTTWGVDPDVAVDLTPDQLTDLLKTRRDNDIIHPAGEAATTQPEGTAITITNPQFQSITVGANAAAAATTGPTTAEAPAPDTQLETAMLMMRLQLVQSK